jgi:arylsulfatase A-like enzyme
MRPFRILSIFAALLVFALAACGSEPETTEERTPNVILIVADDLGYGDVGVYGQEQVRTPRLDRMAEEGLRFMQFYAGSTVCAPSRSVLMEGRHTGHATIRGNREIQPYGQEPLPDSVVTTAEVLREAGYRTGLVGKWGLGGPQTPGHPNNQGFDYFFGYLGQRHAHNYYPEFLFHNHERVDVPGNDLPEPRRGDGAGEAIEKVTYSHDLFADSALAFIDRNRNRPFFLFLALTIPHANNEAGERGMEVPTYGAYASEDWPEPEKGFAAMVTRMDADVGRILDRLQDYQIDENTLVLFTSDNGPHTEGGRDLGFFDSNGPLRGVKRDLYEGGIRVPTVAWWPGRIAAGGVTHHVGYFPDILPTFAALADAEVPAGIDGVDFVPALFGLAADQAPHEYLYWEFYEGGMAQAVRMERWKGVRAAAGDLELYDLEADVSETTDLAAEHPDVVARIDTIMESAHEPSPIDWTGR